ncbi:MAG: hypothetical protein QOJ19_1006 [Acidimicrobiia bacterium]|jgi:hypothetical protein|nr:hypothetical protein [Acidimicrobiia bacterium]
MRPPCITISRSGASGRAGSTDVTAQATRGLAWSAAVGPCTSSRRCNSGQQPPQRAPAEQRMPTSPMEHAPAEMAALMVRSVTALHEQTITTEPRVAGPSLRAVAPRAPPRARRAPDQRMLSAPDARRQEAVSLGRNDADRDGAVSSSCRPRPGSPALSSISRAQEYLSGCRTSERANGLEPGNGRSSHG